MELEKIIEKAKRFLETIPEVDDAILYGSLVSNQANHDTTTAQVDIMAFTKGKVRDWLMEDIDKNPTYYGNKIKKFTKASEKKLLSGVPICYFPGRNFEGTNFKLGIGSLPEALKRNSYFIFGRCDKNIVYVKSEPEFRERVDETRKRDLIASIILLNNKKYDLQSLLKKISSRTYVGDIRMLGFENPHKVRNIVLGDTDNLTKIYLAYGCFETDGNNITINKERASELLETLPSDFRHLIIGDPFKDDGNKLKLLLTKCLLSYYYFEKNWFSSSIMILKGFYTAGFSKAIAYGERKLEQRPFMKKILTKIKSIKKKINK